MPAPAEPVMVVEEVTLPGDDHTNARSPFTGWLVKKKHEGGMSRMFSSTNRRFFTVDYTAQVLYYSQAESTKKVSLPTPFRDIRGVKLFTKDALPDAPPETEEAEAPGIQRTNSKGSLASSMASSLTSRIRRPSLGLARKPTAEQHGFYLSTTERTMELFCSSKAEAEAWVGAIQEAIAVVGNKPGDVSSDDTLKADNSTAPGSSRRTSPCSPRSGIGDAAAIEDLSSLEPEAGEAESDDMKTDAEKDKPQRRTFGLLPPRPPGAEASPGSSMPGSAVESRNGSKSSKDAGVKSKEELMRSSPAMSEPGEIVTAVSECSLGRGMEEAWGGSGNASASLRGPSAAAQRYGDKGQGLSVAERLSQLNFSDDEDDDDDVAGRPSSTGVATGTTPAGFEAARDDPPQPVQEGVEAFHLDPEDASDGD